MRGDGFRVEKIAYESLPGLWVTANVYVPRAGAGPFPAALLPPGHAPSRHFRRAVEQPLHRNLAEVAPPGVLRVYDLGGLMLALGSRQVT